MNRYQRGMLPPDVLECSTHGDVRFSAFGAKLKGIPIEELYQLSKRFGSNQRPPQDWREAKGRNALTFVVNGEEYPARDVDHNYLEQYYYSLWMQYLDANPDLVAHANSFREFNDKFGKVGRVCQADAIHMYVKQGRDAMLKFIQPFMTIVNEKVRVRTMTQLSKHHDEQVKTTVVNKHHNVPFDVNIGRPSKWGNPFSHLPNDGVHTSLATYKVATREEAVAEHREYLLENYDLLLALPEVKGKILCCWCAPNACHGHTIAEFADLLTVYNNPNDVMRYSDEFRVVVAGSRGFQDYAVMKAWLDHLLTNKRETHQIIIVSGGARGADIMGERYAYEHGYRVDRLPANWNLHGRSAGHRRNRDMASIAQACLTFWDGTSPGTRSMNGLAEEFKLAHKCVQY